MALTPLALAAMAVAVRHAPAQSASDSGRSARSEGILSRARIDPRSDIAFQALMMPDTVYVGQQATYQVGVFLSAEVRARLRRNPNFVPPEVRSVLAFDLPSTVNAPPRVVGPRTYDVHVFQRALFPLTAGSHTVPAARLDYALPLSNSFFAREENHTERTSPLRLIARDPPTVGRPPDYRGAVGRLSVSSRLDSRRGRVGDPLTYTVSVGGVGNVMLLPRPAVRIGWADVVAGAERVQMDSGSSMVQGRKDFDWIVTPKQSGALSLPELRYPYFNPYTERYEVALSRPDSVRIAAVSSSIADPTPTDPLPALPIRRVYAGTVPPPLPSRTAYWVVIALTPLPALLLAVARRPARRRTPAPDRYLRALAASHKAIDAPTLRRTYAAAMAERLQATPATMSDHAVLVRTLRRAGVSDAAALGAERLLAELDAVVFGRAGSLSPDAAERARDLMRTIDAEARPREALASRSTRARGIATVAILVAAATAWGAQRDDWAVSSFFDGVRAYDTGEFDVARQAFFDLARARPRSADAWINFGSAAWELHDTAAAVIGWQRGVRLQPMAGDVRQRLELTADFNGGWLGDVPPVSLNVLALAGAALWLAGWTIIAASRAKRRPRLPRLATGMASLAALIAFAGVRQNETLAGKQHVVVVARSQLRAMPMLGAELRAGAEPGEVARVLGRQGAWTRIQLSDRRRGWVESGRVESLGVE